MYNIKNTKKFSMLWFGKMYMLWPIKATVAHKLPQAFHSQHFTYSFYSLPLFPTLFLAKPPNNNKTKKRQLNIG